MKNVFSTMLLLLSGPTFAYAPPYAMIMSRTAENHGRGAFVIEQDLTLHDASTNGVVHETWIVLDENHMKVTFQGAGALKDTVSGTFVYDNHNRLANEGKGARSHPLGDGWLEPFFYFRTVKSIRSRLVQMKIAPSDTLRDRAPLQSDKMPEYQPEPFIKLSRQKGQVTWAIAKSFDGNDQPELWIEQDQFVVTKVRPIAKTSIEAEDYAKYDGGFYFPRVRSYHWGDRSITAQVRSVRMLTNPKSKELLNAASLGVPQFSGSDTFKDFYLRFR